MCDRLVTAKALTFLRTQAPLEEGGKLGCIRLSVRLRVRHTSPVLRELLVPASAIFVSHGACWVVIGPSHLARRCLVTGYNGQTWASDRSGIVILTSFARWESPWSCKECRASYCSLFLAAYAVKCYICIMHTRSESWHE